VVEVVVHLVLLVQVVLVVVQTVLSQQTQVQMLLQISEEVEEAVVVTGLHKEVQVETVVLD
tara:strand:+ start:305 stop:487 length:183 start_codon:yes stop_codon:yes gene_type:complete